MKVGDTVILKNWHKAKVIRLDQGTGEYPYLVGAQVLAGGKEIYVKQDEILRVEAEEDRRGECS